MSAHRTNAYDAGCYHCGADVGRVSGTYQQNLHGELRVFCCPACQSVAVAICEGGLGEFYQYRDSQPSEAFQQPPQQVTPQADAQQSFIGYDLEDVQIEFVKPVAGSESLFEARLFIPNISCAACAWLIEHYLQGVPSVSEVSVNVSSHQCRVVWDKKLCPISQIFYALSRIGYQALPATTNNFTVSRKKRQKTALLQLGLAGVGMMQVGMVAIALHAGGIQGIESHWRGYLRWVSLIFALPIVAYSAQPFFVSAIRALRLGSVNMDVSVSLALLLAFFASVWATVSNTGDVYYDSLSMLVFFLLLGRYLEMRVRHNSADQVETYDQLLPVAVAKWIDGLVSIVPLKSLRVNDCVQVDAGAVFPCDGIVSEGNGHANESILTGEYVPVEKSKGCPIMAGSTNGPSTIVVKVTAVGDQTKLNQIQSMRNSAYEQRPKYQALVNRMAVWFVAAVLIVASINAVVWLFVAPDEAFWVTLSVLVVTCPCALSLATPAALTAGIQRMQSLGLLITSSEFLERAHEVTHVVFDKTGTLTTGKLRVARIMILPSVAHHTESEILNIIAAIEAKSAHPIASAFADIQFETAASNVRVEQGQGIEGEVNHQNYRFGKSRFASPQKAVSYPSVGAWQLLATNEYPVAWVLLEDEVKPEIPSLVKSLQTMGLSVSIASGDREENVAPFALAAGIEEYIAGADPEEKLKYINALQQKGASVLMVGDGINDAPILSGANASIAMGSASQLTKTSADSILLNQHLHIIIQCLHLAQSVHKKIKQNLAWALIYNLIALPLAVLGFIPPYLAAIGMSLSSLIVVINSLSLRRQSI